MRKLIVAAFVSLDGVVESPGDWALQYYTQDEMRQSFLARVTDCDALLFGRVTYEMFAQIAASAKGDPYFDRLGSLPKHVASKTLREATWNATVIQGDVAKEVAKLKAQPGKNIMKYGCGSLDKTLVEHDLIDEFHFTIFPVIAGKGQRLFEGIDMSRQKFSLTETKRYSNGAITLSYIKAK